jgi:mRNA-degrading endonuclease RelE of RelBE toxin-antitoxin system
MYNLVIKELARKELDKVPDACFLKIDEVILSLRENPYICPESKKLQGANKYRLSVGKSKIFYIIDEERKTIIIYCVQHK